MAGDKSASGEVRFAPAHPFLPVNGHPDDDECTHREDGTDATYCGRPQAEHERDCDRCGAGALYVVTCWLGCLHAQCAVCAEWTEREAKQGRGTPAPTPKGDDR